MSDAALLNELCSICNTNKHKYRCPGCSARTCSLPCYKRHQQWAQCSGQRDPTKFVKKSELVTPSGIDHDFNFLSDIERNLQKAEKKVASATAPGPPPEAQSKRERAGVSYRKIEEATGVTIIQAPQGLSRQKENKSHVSAQKRASKNVVWTIEWFDETKRRMLTQISSTQQIKDAQPFVQHTTKPIHKSKKRKLNTEALTLLASPSPSPLHHPDEQRSIETEDGPSPSEDQIRQLEVNNEKPELFTPGRRASPQKQIQEREAIVADTHSLEPSIHGPDSQPLDNGQRLYFLLRPRTSTSRHVLIPLVPSHTLAESLYGQTVLEFPTVYTFPTSMEKLPEEFMLEEEYVKQEGEEQKEYDELMRELDPEILKRLKEGDGRVQSERMGGEEQIDEKGILDVLKQDLGGRL